MCFFFFLVDNDNILPASDDFLEAFGKDLDIPLLSNAYDESPDEIMRNAFDGIDLDIQHSVDTFLPIGIV